jgi:hypothetical protein
MERTSASNIDYNKPQRSSNSSMEDLVRVGAHDDEELEIMIDVDIENVHEIERRDISYRESITSLHV